MQSLKPPRNLNWLQFGHFHNCQGINLYFQSRLFHDLHNNILHAAHIQSYVTYWRLFSVSWYCGPDNPHTTQCKLCGHKLCIPVRDLCVFALPSLWDALTDLTVKFNVFAAHHLFAEVFHGWMLDPARRYNVTILVKSSSSNFSHTKQKRLASDYGSDRGSLLKLVTCSILHAFIHSLSL